MTVAALNPPVGPRLSSARALEWSARLWFLVAAIGQGLFLAYILALYGVGVVSGAFESGRLDESIIPGHVPGDAPGNLAFVAHMALAAAVTASGLLQLVQPIRTRWPAAHRFNGRFFLATAAIASVTGLYMTWVRAANLGLVGAIAITIDAAFILGFGWLAYTTARARRIVQHRRWALRTFMVVNAVWFLRVGLPPLGLLSIALTGEEPSLSSPIFLAWNFGCYLVPLAVLELYFRAKDGGSARGRWAMAGGLVVVTAIMAFGIFGSWFALFAPRLEAAA